jgi:hypothetical protein
MSRVTSAVLLAALAISPVMAQQPPPIYPRQLPRQPPVGHPAPPERPIEAQLNAIFGQLAQTVKQADQIAGELRATASKGPAEMRQRVEAGANWMSTLADKLSDRGEVLMQLRALRAAAVAHRKRIADEKGLLAESDRTKLLQVWSNVIAQADSAVAAVGSIRGQVLDALTSLRMRELAISEFMAAGQYQDAIASLNAWLAQLQVTVNHMKATISQFQPSPPGA